jgi:hypothetical protein
MCASPNTELDAKDERQSSAKERNAGHLDRFVPRTGSEDATLRSLEPFDDLDWRVVLGDLLRLPGLDVIETRRIVTTTRYDLVSLL